MCIAVNDPANCSRAIDPGLYIVATPIGNLEDVTMRALRTLADVDVIVCEDTRTTQKLLKHYDITNQLFSWHAQSSQSDLLKVVNWLTEGKSIAYVTDAGTPGVSDPGMMLVATVRDFDPDIPIVAVPGASALTAAISISGVSMSQFLWLGFLPHKKGRQTMFKEIASAERPVIFYESPHRIVKTIKSLIDFTPNKRVTLFRELTKVYEEVVTGSPQDLFHKISNEDLVTKGEFVVIVS